jgi:uncharacterized membrane protein HdeD (DUF308 family)
MSTNSVTETLRRNWGWFLALGIMQLTLGAAALLFVWIATIASVLVFGWFMIVAGVVETVAAISGRRGDGFFLHLLCAVLDLVVGVLVVANPGAAAVALTLLLAAFFLITGLFRVGAALAMHPSNRGWELLGGAVTTVLGVLIGAQWPSSSVWVIGTFVGIDLIFRGWSWLMLGLMIREPSRAEASIAPSPSPTA